MPLFMNFTEREIMQLQLYARGQRHRADNQADGDVDFWDSLLSKLATIWQHPMCCWCDSRDWSLDNPDTIPDAFGCQHDADVAALRAERDKYQAACAAMHDFWTNPDSDESVPHILNLVTDAIKGT